MAELRGPVDFVLAVGDDIADELMFDTVNSLKGDRKMILKRQARTFTCTVGRKPSRANYYVNEANEISHLLEMI